MKRKRKIRKTFTDAQKRGLVNEVIILLNQGVKLTQARLEVARKHKTTPISLARWSKDITTDIVNTQPKRTNGISKVHVTSVNLHVPGKGNITLDHELLNHISKLAGYTS